MKIWMNLRSYSRFPSASAIFTESSALATFCCSCADQATERCKAAFGACDSPIRGWLRNASSQSDSAKLGKVSSDASRSAASWGGGFPQPTPPPPLGDHNTAVSHRRPLEWEENSSAPAHHSYRLPTAAQLLEKFH